MKHSSYQLCLAVEENVFGNTGPDCSRNALMNYNRVNGIFNLIKNQLKLFNKKISVLNLSGLNGGQFDLALKAILIENDIEIDRWVAYDTVDNIHLKNEWLLNQLDCQNISLVYSDFNNKFTLQTNNSYDLVILSDVIEHINYGSALNLISNAHSQLVNGGVCIISCPNPHWFIDRLRYLIGGDPWFDLDIRSHLISPFYGHINIFSKQRLLAIAEAVSFNVLTISTINHWRYCFRDNTLKYFLQKILDIINFAVPFSSFTLVLLLRK